jgi:uncharacterized protein
MSVTPASGSRASSVAPQAGALSLAVADLGMPILIVPGLRNSGPVHWQSHWQKQMPDSRRVAQKDWFNADPQAWAATLAREIDAAPEPPMVIAHSFGCLATVLAAFGGARIRAALLVAPADPERFGIGTELACKPLPFASTLVASSNDPWLKLIRAGTLAAAWGSQFVLYRNAGHINAESGFGPWPQGLTHVHELARRAIHGGTSERATRPFAN